VIKVAQTFLSRRSIVQIFFIFLAFFLAVGLVNTAAAQSGSREVTDDEVNEIAQDLYCPICESTPLDVCPTQACEDWREIIRTKLSQGETEQQIKDYFVDQYGPRALAEPPREGFTLAVWIIPIAAVIIGGFFFTRYLRGIQTTASTSTSVTQETSQSAPASKPAPETAQDDYITRVERELQERTK
jgi:cytochrome c-type biogenesis protein CcmH